MFNNYVSQANSLITVQTTGVKILCTTIERDHHRLHDQKEVSPSRTHVACPLCHPRPSQSSSTFVVQMAKVSLDWTEQGIRTVCLWHSTRSRREFWLLGTTAVDLTFSEYGRHTHGLIANARVSQVKLAKAFFFFFLLFFNL